MIRIGHMRYVLGNVRISQSALTDPESVRDSQSALEEAHILHQKALKCWRVVMGEYHHKTGDAWHKNGWHLARKGQFQDARYFGVETSLIRILLIRSSNALERALSVYRSGSDQSFRQGEIARTTFKLGLVLAEMGMEKESKEHLSEATNIRKSLLRERFAPTMDEKAFDELVSLWAR